MIKRLLAVAAAALFVGGLYGCSADCEVCSGVGDEKECNVVKDVKKSDCKDCEDIEGMAEAKTMAAAFGVDLQFTCTVK
ncbi:MAG: hypothetical protein JW913_01790 [Chitinispirillaceae bacterium]|nr:hypothetical protein [Chitinispirillaceae bacterium]